MGDVSDTPTMMRMKLCLDHSWITMTVGLRHTHFDRDNRDIHPSPGRFPLPSITGVNHRSKRYWNNPTTNSFVRSVVSWNVPDGTFQCHHNPPIGSWTFYSVCSSHPRKGRTDDIKMSSSSSLSRPWSPPSVSPWHFKTGFQSFFLVQPSVTRYHLSWWVTRGGWPMGYRVTYTHPDGWRMGVSSHLNHPVEWQI